MLSLVAIIGLNYLPHQPFKPDMRAALQPPSHQHLLGTDNLGRCVACRIVLQGKHLETMTPRQLRDVRGGEIAMIFQQPESSFDPIRTIGDQFCETMKLHERATKAGALSRADTILRGLGFDDPARVLGSYPFELSGGMCQRAAIARALMANPDLLLCDEITSALHVSVQAQVMALLMDVRRTGDISMLFISHDIALVSMLCDRLLVMYRGAIVEDGATAEIIHNSQNDYTRCLIASVFTADDWEKELYAESPLFEICARRVK